MFPKRRTSNVTAKCLNTFVGSLRIAVGSPCVPASSSYRNLKLRITVKMTTFMRDKLFIYEITLVVFYKYTRQTNKMC